jgi:hypothetical protein
VQPDRLAVEGGHQVVGQRDSAAVVHVPVGGDAETGREQPGEQEHEGGTVVGQRHRVGDLDLVASERCRQQRGHGQGQHEHDPHHGLDEREGPAAQLVGHLEPQQRVAGHPGHAGERPDHERDEDGDDQVRDQPEQREGQPRTEDGQAEQPHAALKPAPAAAERCAAYQPHEDRANTRP